MSVGDWSVLDSTVEYECPWFTVGADRVARPDGDTARYYWVEPGDAVTVVAVEDDQLVLVEQYRPRQRDRFLSCPVGGVEEGESFTRAAKRELREETGFEAGDVKLLETYHAAGWLRMRRGVVFATDLTPGEQSLDDGEFIEVHTVPVDTALNTARTEPVHEWTLLPLLLAAEEGMLDAA